MDPNGHSRVRHRGWYVYLQLMGEPIAPPQVRSFIRHNANPV